MNLKRCELVTISLRGQHRRQMVTVYCYGEFLTKSEAIQLYEDLLNVFVLL